jgi:hypothetical protein
MECWLWLAMYDDKNNASVSSAVLLRWSVGCGSHGRKPLLTRGRFSSGTSRVFIVRTDAYNNRAGRNFVPTPDDVV